MQKLPTMADTYNSPKRKRDSPPTPPPSSPLQLIASLTIPTASMVEEEDSGKGSPRSNVAYHFQGLQLEGVAVSKLDLRKLDAADDGMLNGNMKDESVVRKRMKILEKRECEIPETPAPRAFTISIRPERKINPLTQENASQPILHNDLDPVIFKGTTGRVNGAGLARAYPSINRLSDSKSRGRNRMGTPPLFGSTDVTFEEETAIVDPDRAALTWHDDEITGHNPDDPDDDGEGINGIGFKPTPAIAYARTEKRRQQMVEYKNREAREARAKRSERRRGTEISKPSSKEVETVRRVRFLESEPKVVAII